MKKIILTLMVLVLVGNIAQSKVINVKADDNKYKMTTSTKNINVKVVYSSKNKIKVKFINKGKVRYVFSEAFILKKYSKGKWKKVKFKDKVMFKKSVFVEPNSSKTIIIKSNKFFDKQLTKGKYKIKYGLAKKYTKFRIK